MVGVAYFCKVDCFLIDCGYVLTAAEDSHHRALHLLIVRDYARHTVPLVHRAAPTIGQGACGALGTLQKDDGTIILPR